ncbi:deoxynucleoside kinase [Bacillus toyonensis]|uniref:deoxynucleoside kinase n=1 Tax=Bacillus toyonensis TaxID=155322 RepID=UPI002E21BD29|nr:deoxynucleoside kinase [Bacillus toyonensis]
MIVIGGMIGLGKTSVAELLSNFFKSEIYYESVDNNPILPLFYTLSEEELLKQRLPFLLQLHFLHTRFESIRNAKKNRLSILDRSLAEDEYFATVNYELGRISELELDMYKQIMHSMMKEIEELPYKKNPDLMVYLKGSFETVMTRIGLRGREFEQDQKLIEYYRTLWRGYDDWIHNHYNQSDILILDMDTLDIVTRKEDAQFVIDAVQNKLNNLQQTN